ncbi:uncharacterized protein LOC136031791 isoform X2 [Artemia franciscana]|uniref:uncharacterized protein LOC136031791 isoform X2 n=1 Tax=Artemia franciscana TaxID=6661 RepID=UPI0032DB2782
MISAVVLAKWDNVVGPRTLKVWGPRSNDEFSCTTGLKFSWAGEAGNDTDELDEAWEAENFEFDREESPEIVCVSDRSSSNSIVVVSCGASGQTNNSDSVSGAFDSGQLESSQYAVLETDLSHNLFNLNLPEEEGRMKVFLCDTVKYVTEHTVIACLSKPGIEELNLIKSSYFVVPDFYSVMICSTFYVDEYVTDCGTLESSYSVSVVGDIEDENMFMLLREYIECNLKEIAMFIKALPEIIASFLRRFLWDDSQKQRCRIISDMEHECFIPFLYVQGYVFSRMKKKPSVREILMNVYPITQIDLSVSPVVTIQSSSYVDHNQRRRKSTKKQSKNLVQTLTMKTGKNKRVQNQPSRLVSALLEKLVSNGSSQWEDVIKRFKRSLFLKASHLLSAKDGLEKNELNVQDAVIKRDGLRDLLMMKVGPTHSDFLIILAVAEYLRPGIYEELYRNTDS